ncbi:MAG: DUF1850 domain-containing protein [Rhodocyclaceae bacterium]
MACVASGLLATELALSAFTLGWTHSIEKVRWEEDWRVEAGALVLVEGRVHGSGAGMEPPDGAELVGGVWRYRPPLRVPRLSLAHSPFVRGHEVCDGDGRCRPLADWLPGLPAYATIDILPCADDVPGAP